MSPQCPQMPSPRTLETSDVARPVPLGRDRSGFNRLFIPSSHLFRFIYFSND